MLTRNLFLGGGQTCGGGAEARVELLQGVAGQQAVRPGSWRGLPLARRHRAGRAREGRARTANHLLKCISVSGSIISDILLPESLHYQALSGWSPYCPEVLEEAPWAGPQSTGCGRWSPSSGGGEGGGQADHCCCQCSSEEEELRNILVWIQ